MSSRNDELTPKLLDEVSSKIGNGWRHIGRNLGLEKYELDHIDCDNYMTQEKAIQVLYKWKQITGHTTWEELKKVLDTCKYKDLISEIEHDFQCLNRSSASSSAVVQNNTNIVLDAPQVSAKVLYPYEAIEQNEHTLVIGEIIKKVVKNDDGWWEGEIGGRRGIFPSSFVEVIDTIPIQESGQFNTYVESTIMKPHAYALGSSCSSDSVSNQDATN